MKDTINKLGFGIFVVLPFSFVVYGDWLRSEIYNEGLQNLNFDSVSLIVSVVVPVFIFGVIFCLFHLYRNRNVDTKHKKWWTGAILFGHLIVIPIYWWFHIYPKNKRARKKRVRKPSPVRGEKG